MKNDIANTTLIKGEFPHNLILISASDLSLKERKKHYCNNKETYEKACKEFNDRAAAYKNEPAHYFTEAIYIKFFHIYILLMFI